MSVDVTKTVEFDADNLHVLAVWTVIELQLFVNVVLTRSLIICKCITAEYLSIYSS